MFENSAGKLKSILSVLFWLTQIGAVIVACVLAEDNNWLSMLIIPIVFFVSWFSSLFVMAILEAMENIYNINEKLKKSEKYIDCIHENLLTVTKVVERKYPDLLDKPNCENAPKKLKKANTFPRRERQVVFKDGENDIYL